MKWRVKKNIIYKHLKLLPGYSARSRIMDSTSNERYEEKIKIMNGNDLLYKVHVCDWENNVELWPAMTHVHACMHVLSSHS